MAQLVSKRYGRALFELALENDIIDESESAVELILGSFESDVDLYTVLTNPNVHKDEKLTLFDNIFKDKIPELVNNFFKVILKKNREQDMQDILFYFRELVMAKKGISIAKVFTTVPLTEPQKDKIKEKLESVTGKQILIESEIKKELLGGLYIEVDGQVIDNTFSKKIKEIRQNLLDYQFA